MLYKSLKIGMVVLVLLVTFFTGCTLSNAQENYPVIANIEELVFGKTFPDLKISDRLSSIEKNTFGKTYESDSLAGRTERLKTYILGGQDEEINAAGTQAGYENNLTKEISTEEFVDILFQKINEERTIKGLLPLANDAIAVKLAGEHVKELIMMGYLSYYNSKNQCPDERYTLAGGTGAVTEIVKGFEQDGKENKNEKIKITSLLAQNLVQALRSDKDDLNILFSPYLTHFGCAIYLSNDKNRFVSVLEFLIKGGELESLKPFITLGEKLFVSGKINSPFKFKAISLAYFEMENKESQGSFDDEDLLPYFPPQDYIAYANTAKSNFLKVLKGLGVIGAIGASPFTGGASAVLAPVLLSSIQNGPPKEIPLKGGIKVKANGEFAGELELNYQGMTGIYFVSILGELSNINFPVVISRRTVKVDSPLKNKQLTRRI